MTSRRTKWGTSAAVALFVAAACTPTPGGGGGTTTTTPGTTTTTTTTTTTVPSGDDAVTVFFIGDSEPRMRGNTNAEIAAYVENLASLGTTPTDYFDHGDGATYPLAPDLVMLGGDISEDRNTSIANDLALWQPLYDAGIGFIAGFGNHDWDPATWSDGSPGYSVAGHLSNENTTAFTRETYRRTQALGGFSYREVAPTSTHGPVTYHADFRGIELVNFNTFLYHPSYYYPEGWPLSCNVLAGGAGCQIFVSAENQIQRMEDLITDDRDTPVLFMEHYPLSTSDSWWNDHGASTTTVQQKQDRLLSLVAEHDEALLLTAHNHFASSAEHEVGVHTVNEYVAPYFGGANGEDLSRGGGFVAILVSPTRGILEVKTVPTAF